MNADGTAQRAAGPERRAIKPAPLPDGRVVYETWTVGEHGHLGGWELRVFDLRAGTDVSLDSGAIVCHDPAASSKGNAILCNGVARDAFANVRSTAGFPGPLLAPGFPGKLHLPDRSIALCAFRDAFGVPLNPVADEVAVRTNPYTVELMSLQTGKSRSLLAFDSTKLAPSHRAIVDLIWSPDGRQIAVSLKKFRDSTAPGEIWMVNADGTSLRNLTGGRATAAGMPSFGDDGRKIAFTARVGKTTNLMLMNADGSDVRPLTHTDDRENFAALSPSGEWLVYASDRDGVRDPPTGERRMGLYLARITPSGELVDTRRLTKTSAQVGHPRFSPDGHWIVYTSGQGGLNDEAPLTTSLMFSPQPYGEIWAQRLSDGRLVRLTHDKWEDGEPFWVPPLSGSPK